MEKSVEVRKLALDELGLQRLDFMKIDIEGMELEALQGALQTIERARPIILIESVKSGAASLLAWLQQRGYRVSTVGINLLAIHIDDPSINDVTID